MSVNQNSRQNGKRSAIFGRLADRGRSLSGPLFLAGIILALGFWFGDALFIAHFGGDLGFGESAFSPAASDVWRRLLTGAMFVGLGAFAQNFLNRQTAQGFMGKHLFSLVDGSNAIMCLTSIDGKFIHVNDALCELLGYSRDEMKTLHIGEVTHPDDMGSSTALMQSLGKNDKTKFELEKRYIHKSGHEIEVQLSVSVIRDIGGTPQGFLTQIKNISKSKRAERDLRDRERWLREAIKSLAVGVIVIEEDGEITQFNALAEKIFGYRANEVIGKNISMLMPEPDRSNHPQYLRNYIETGKKKIIGFGREVSGLHKNGQTFPLYLGIGEVVLKGKPQFVGSIIDLREQFALQDQLRQAQKMESVGQLTGGVAHDFNNLLGVILGNLSLLKDDLLENSPLCTADIMGLVQPALDASERGAALTDRLLAFSRKKALRSEALDMNQVIEGMKAMLSRTLGEEIDLRFYLEGVDWLAEADMSQLENALLNLAINARDAMPHGGRLTIATSQITLNGKPGRLHKEMAPGDYLVLAVSDTGVGIAAENIEKVFEPFFTTKGMGMGTGLGLSMVYGFAKQSGGHVLIHSEPGEGTAVELFLPRSEATKAAITEEGLPSPQECGGESILIVEDDEDVRLMVKRILERCGYTVTEAGDGLEGLALLENGGPFDLLLIDVVLPGGLSGPDVAKWAAEFIPGIKVRYMSGYTDAAISRHSGLIDGENLINKPFSHTELVSRIREALLS